MSYLLMGLHFAAALLNEPMQDHQYNDDYFVVQRASMEDEYFKDLQLSIENADKEVVQQKLITIKNILNNTDYMSCLNKAQEHVQELLANPMSSDKGTKLNAIKTMLRSYESPFRKILIKFLR